MRSISVNHDTFSVKNSHDDDGVFRANNVLFSYTNLRSFLDVHSALKFSKKTQLIIWEITLRTKKFSKNVNHLMTQHILKSKLFDFFMELPRRS